MSILKLGRVLRASVFALALPGLATSGAHALEEIGENLEISGEVFVLTELTWGDTSGPKTFNIFTDAGGGSTLPATAFVGAPYPVNLDRYDTLTAFRTEILVEASYRGIPHFTPVIKLRPYFDGSFGIEGKHDQIQRDWETNISDGLHDEWDPLVREAYVDVNYHPFFVRAGRQIVTWGRSDGVSVMDVVNPRNFRNPLTFEQERFQIPQWMINATWDMSKYEWLPLGISKELQVVWNMDYLPSRFPGFRPEENGLHPWTLNVVDLADQIIQASRNLFNEADFFDGDKYKRGDFWDNSEVFVRWRGRTGSDLGPLSDLTYSFHYGHLYNDVPLYNLSDVRIDAGLPFTIAGPRAIGGGIDFEKRRYDLYGVSFDKALTFLPGQLEGTVIRGEVAYNSGDSFYNPDFELEKHDNLTFLIGLDQYLYLSPRSWVETPWFTSFQFWHDQILHKPEIGDTTKIGSVSCNAQPGCGDAGYVIGSAFNLFNGMRDESRSIVTLYMFNDFLPGKTLRVELFGLHEFEGGGSWFRGLVGYTFNSWISARVGTNIVWGPRDGFFGEFKKNDSVFTELKFTF